MTLWPEIWQHDMMYNEADHYLNGCAQPMFAFSDLGQLWVMSFSEHLVVFDVFWYEHKNGKLISEFQNKVLYMGYEWHVLIKALLIDQTTLYVARSKATPIRKQTSNRQHAVMGNGSWVSQWDWKHQNICISYSNESCSSVPDLTVRERPLSKLTNSLF